VQGAINMHLPERWGVLQFAEGPVNGTIPQRYPDWPAREVAMALYYAQKAFADSHNGSYTTDLAALAVRPFPSCVLVSAVLLSGTMIMFMHRLSCCTDLNATLILWYLYVCTAHPLVLIFMHRCSYGTCTYEPLSLLY
jgi:hypothetical protein